MARVGDEGGTRSFGATRALSGFLFGFRVVPGGRRSAERVLPGGAMFRRPFNHPTAVAVSLNGEIYVADGYGNSRVHKFSPDGRLLLSWGSPGKGPGQFRVPHSIWVDRNQRVSVCDRENDRVQ